LKADRLAFEAKGRQTGFTGWGVPDEESPIFLVRLFILSILLILSSSRVLN
jgi:hypothetical protein